MLSATAGLSLMGCCWELAVSLSCSGAQGLEGTVLVGSAKDGFFPFIYYYYYYYFWLRHAACEISVPQPDIEPGPPQ